VNGFRVVGGQVLGARLARSVLLTSLQQSPRLQPIADQDLFPVLKRMDPGGSLPLAGQALTTLLTQLRAAFWIDGNLQQAGGRYSLDVQLLNASGPPAGGRVVVS